jgi:N utilization substance protein B
MSKENKKLVSKRSVSRLLAVQIIYSKNVCGLEKDSYALVNDLLDVFSRENDIATGNKSKHDTDFVHELVAGSIHHQEKIDELISDNLSSTWSIERLSAVLHAILQSAIYELLHVDSNPTNIIINEYIELARAFFSEKEVKFVNGILDTISKKVRS